MPHFESPIPSAGSAMTPDSCSHSESTLLESYVLEASELPGPTITTDTTLNDHDQEHTLATTTTTAITTTAAAATAHFLSHMHLSPLHASPDYPNYQTTATANLQDLRQSLLLSHELDLLLRQSLLLSHDLDLFFLQELPLVALTLDEHLAGNIPIGEFPPRPYFPLEEEREPGTGRTIQGGYAVERFLNAGIGEEPNVVYALSHVS